MDAKAYLSQVKLLDVRINQSLEEIEHLKSIVYKITPTLRQDSGGMSEGSDQDKIGNAIAKIIDLEAQVNADIDAYVDLKRKVMRKLEKVKDPDQFQVLHKRYFLYQTFESIAEQMNRSLRSILYIHGYGLKSMNEILKSK